MIFVFPSFPSGTIHGNEFRLPVSVNFPLTRLYVVCVYGFCGRFFLNNNYQLTNKKNRLTRSNAWKIINYTYFTFPTRYNNITPAVFNIQYVLTINNKSTASEYKFILAVSGAQDVTFLIRRFITPRPPS